MGAEVLDASGQTINLRLTPLDMSDAQRALAGGPRTSRNSTERDRLAQAYARASSPSIAVVINRAVSGATTPPPPPNSSATTSGAPATSIIVGNRVDLSGGAMIDPVLAPIVQEELADRREERNEQREFDVRAIEARVVQRLASLGLNLTDTAAAQAALTQSGELAETSMTDREFASLLGTKTNADVVVSGVARVTRTRAGDFPLRVELTMQAVRRADSRVLGAATSSREVASAGATMDQALDALSAEAVGRLATQLAQSWEK
jgi:hypothetical protein